MTVPPSFPAPPVQHASPLSPPQCCARLSYVLTHGAPERSAIGQYCCKGHAQIGGWHPTPEAAIDAAISAQGPNDEQPSASIPPPNATNLALMIAESALTLIASPVRPDGTYNRDRAACGALALKALREMRDALRPLPGG